MTEMTIRRMPWTCDETKRSIVQIPLDGKEQVYQLPELLLNNDPEWAIEWITPVQVSQQYTGVPSPGFTFVVRPMSESDAGEGQRAWDSDRMVYPQMVDVFYHLKLVQSFSIGGPHGRIVAGSQYVQVGDGVQDLSVLSSTMAFLVQAKRVPDVEDTENSLTHKLQQP